MGVTRAGGVKAEVMAVAGAGVVALVSGGRRVGPIAAVSAEVVVPGPMGARRTRLRAFGRASAVAARAPERAFEEAPGVGRRPSVGRGAPQDAGKVGRRPAAVLTRAGRGGAPCAASGAPVGVAVASSNAASRALRPSASVCARPLHRPNPAAAARWRALAAGTGDEPVEALKPIPGRAPRVIPNGPIPAAGPRVVEAMAGRRAIRAPTAGDTRAPPTLTGTAIRPLKAAPRPSVVATGMGAVARAPSAKGGTGPPGGRGAPRTGPWSVRPMPAPWATPVRRATPGAAPRVKVAPVGGAVPFLGGHFF